MAIIARLADGRRLRFPDGTDPAVIDQTVQRVIAESQGPTQPAIPQEDREGFGAAAAASLARMEGERALVKGKSGLISDDEAMRIYNAQKAEADRLFSPTDDTFSWRGLKELAGGSLPYMAAPVAAGVAGSVVGTPAVGIGASFVTSAAQFSGSNLARQIDEGKSLQEASGGKAITAAIPMAALDTFALGKIPGVRQILGRAGIEVSEDAAAAIARKGVAHAAMDYTKATGKALTYEGATEAGQQFFERLQAGLDIADEAARKEYYDSFIGGAVLGGALAPAGRYVERRGAQKDVEAKKEDEKRVALEDQIITAQQEEEALAAAQDVDPETPVNDLLRERSQLLISGNTDPVTLARIKALEQVINPQVQGDINTLEEDLFGEFVQPTEAPAAEAEEAPTLTKAERRLQRQEAVDAGQMELPLRRTPAGQPTTTPIPVPEPVAPLPEGALSMKDIEDTNVPMKTSRGWFNENVVGKTPEEVQALVTADPSLIEGRGQRARVLREILAPKPPAFEEAPRGPETSTGTQLEFGFPTGPADAEPAVSERAADQPSVGIPDVPAVEEQPGVAGVSGPPAEPAAPEQPGVVDTGLPAGDGATQPKPSRKRTLKPVRAEEITVGDELKNWRNIRSRVKTPGALVGNAEVEAFLHAVDNEDHVGARDALDDVARVLRSLPKGGNQAARAFVEYMNKRTQGEFDRILTTSFDRIREIPSAPAPVQDTEAQDRTRRKPTIDKKYLEPVRITKDNLVVRGSQRLLVPMDDATAKKYLAERTLGKLEEAVEPAPTRQTPQAGQKELDFTAKQPEPKKPEPVVEKKPEPVVEKKPTKQPWMKNVATVFGDARTVPVSDTLALAMAKATNGRTIIIGTKHNPTASDPDNFLYTNKDLSAGTPAGFTADETAQLMEAYGKLAKERSDLDAKYPDGKFPADSNIITSPKTAEYAGYIRGLVQQLGLGDKRLYVFMGGESRSDPMALGITPHFEWLDNSLGDTTARFAMLNDRPNVGALILNEEQLANKSKQEILETIAHEIGHMVEHMALAHATPETKAALEKAHRAWLQQQKGASVRDLVEALRNREVARSTLEGAQMDVSLPAERVSNYRYLTSFSEWFADNVSRWATTDEKPVGLVEKFFADVAKQLRKLASIVTGKRFLPDREVVRFLRSIGPMDAVSLDTNLLGTKPVTSDLNPSIDAIVASSELAQAQPGPVKRAMSLMVDAFSDTAGIDFADKFRTLTVDTAASAERRLNVLFDGAVRSSKGILNPMGLYRQAQDTTKLLLDWFIDGSLVKDKTTGLYNTEQSKTSMKSVLGKVDAWGKANGYSFKEAYNTLSKVLEAKRLDALRKENQLRKAKGEEPFGINKLSNKDKRSADAQIDEMLAFAAKHDAEVKAIQSEMDQIRFGLIDGMVSTGRLSAADGTAWKEATDYIPFDRLSAFDEKFRTQKRAGKGISQLGKIPEFIGSDSREVGNTFDNFVKTAGWMIEQTLKQDANTSTLKMLERLGQATSRKSKTGISDAKLVSAYDKGEQVYYELPSRWDVMAFKDLAPPKGALVNFLAGFSNILRTAITSLPPFAVRQVVNDIQRAYATSGVEKPLKLVYPAIRNFLTISGYELMGKRHPSVREFGKKGVIGDYDFNTRDPMASILHDLGYQARGKLFGLPLKEMMHRLEGITRASDLAVRKAIYDQTMREKNDKLLATTRSREFINFRRRGAGSVLPALASTIPFFNAYLQGMDVLLRAATGKSAAAGLSKAAAKRMFFTKITQMTAFSTIYAIMSSGEDYYDEAGLLVRHNNWMLPGGIKFPVPEELGAIFKVPAEMMVEYFMRNGTKEEMEAADATFTALKYAFAQYAPVGGRMTPIPAAIKPVIEAVTNYSFFTGRELEGVYQRGQLLPSQRTRANTSELAKAISKFTESIVGENNAISPIMIDNTLQGYFGSVAGMVTMFTDQRINPDRMDRPIQKYWMLSNFLYDPIGTRRLDEFYDLRSKTFGVKGTLEKLAKEDLDAAVKFADEHVNELTLAQGIGSALAQLSDTRKYKNYLNSSLAAQEMSQEERKTTMEEVRRMEQELVGWLREVQADMNKAK